MQIKKRKLSKKIKLYYQQEVDMDLVKEVVSFFCDGQDDSSFRLFKENKALRRKLYRFNFAGQGYYIKSYSSRRKKKIIKNFFRKGKGVKAFKISYKLMEAGIEIVPPVFALSYQDSPLIYDSVFVTKEVAVDNLFEFLLKNQHNQKIRRVLAKKMGQLWAKINNNKFFHKDSALWNFLVVEQGELKIILVDVDDIYKYPFLPRLFKVKNLARFNASLLHHFVKNEIEFLTWRERVLFFKEFEHNYKENFELKELIKLVNKQTIERLKKRGHLNLVAKDSFLQNDMD